MNPALAFLRRIPILTPDWVWQNLNYYLRLWIAIWITELKRLLRMFGIPWNAVEMVCFIREEQGVTAMNASPVRECVIRRTLGNGTRTTMVDFVGINDHFAVPGNI